jgi:hypothetical protein
MLGRKSWILHHRQTHNMQVQLMEVLFINNIIYTNEIQFLAIVSVQCTGVWHMMTCNLIERYQHVGRRFKSCEIFCHS